MEHAVDAWVVSSSKGEVVSNLCGRCSGGVAASQPRPLLNVTRRKYTPIQIALYNARSAPLGDKELWSWVGATLDWQPLERKKDQQERKKIKDY
jgi:hypothetical protein